MKCVPIWIIKRVKTVSYPIIALYFFFLLAIMPSALQAKITVGIIGDQFGVKGTVGTAQFDQNLEASYQAMAEGVTALNRAGEMDTVLHVGDLLESTRKNEKIAVDFNRATGILDTLLSKSQPKWFLSPGDHDVNPLQWVQNSPDRSKEIFFKSLYRQINPAAEKDLFYSFDIKGYHFVALYSHEHLRTDPRWGNVFFAKISDRQLAWLKTDLKKAADTQGIIVFTHQPLWYNGSSWHRVHEVLAQYNTKAVIAGHYHYDQDDHESDGIQYRVVGAVGGRIKTATARSGGWWHVTRLTIEDDGSLSWKLIPVGGDTCHGEKSPSRKNMGYNGLKKEPKENFTRRYDMDRIQVLDYLLGNAAQQLAKKPIYVNEGALVDKDGMSPARITLSGFGNPIDQVIEATIAVKTGSDYTLESEYFEPGLCDTLSENSPGQTDNINNTTTTSPCHIPPGANIVLSNNATVQAACAQYNADYSQCLAYKPFWRAVVVYIGNNLPKPGDGVPLTITLTFDSKMDNAPMAIWRDITVPVLALP